MIDIYKEIVNLKQNGGEGVLVTVVDKEGHTPSQVQTKMLVYSDGTRAGTVGGGALEYKAVQMADTVLKNGKGCLKKYLLSADNEIIDAEKTEMLCGGSTTLFYEYIGSGEKIFIFGAGHIGKALIYHLKNLNYYITVLDTREEFVQDIDGVQRRVSGELEDLFKEDVAEDSFIIIATHTHEMDYLILKGVYEAGWKPRYIGLIASARKASVIIKRVAESGVNDIDWDILYSPIGLDIGGSSPDDIAISVISEVQAMRYGKDGNKHLRKVSAALKNS